VQKKVQIHVAHEVQSIATITDVGQVVERPRKPAPPASQTAWPYKVEHEAEEEIVRRKLLAKKKIAEKTHETLAHVP